MSDARAALAREAHRLAGESEVQAAQHRARRDRLIRQLREEDPQHWTYPTLASAVGCSPELIAAIVKGRTSRLTS
jgi:AraC-like DNA-binding protein